MLLCPGLFHVNQTAGDFAIGVAGGLCDEIGRVTMDDHRSSKDVLHTETVCSNCQMGVALVH